MYTLFTLSLICLSLTISCYVLILLLSFGVESWLKRRLCREYEAVLELSSWSLRLFPLTLRLRGVHLSCPSKWLIRLPVLTVIVRDFGRSIELTETRDGQFYDLTGACNFVVPESQNNSSLLSPLPELDLKVAVSQSWLYSAVLGAPLFINEFNLCGNPGAQRLDLIELKSNEAVITLAGDRTKEELTLAGPIELAPALLSRIQSHLPVRLGQSLINELVQIDIFSQLKLRESSLQVTLTALSPEQLSAVSAITYDLKKQRCLDVECIVQLASSVFKDWVLDQVAARIGVRPEVDLGSQFRLIWNPEVGMQAELESGIGDYQLHGEQSTDGWDFKLIGETPKSVVNTLAKRLSAPEIGLQADESVSSLFIARNLGLSSFKNRELNGSLELKCSQFEVQDRSQDVEFELANLHVALELQCSADLIKGEFVSGECEFLKGRVAIEKGGFELSPSLSDFDYQLSLKYAGLSLGDWPIKAQNNHPGTTLQHIIAGIASGELEVSGQRDVESLRGKGSLCLAEAEYNFLNEVQNWPSRLRLPTIQTGGLGEGRARLEIAGTSLRLIEVRAPLVGMLIEGDWGFDRQQQVSASLLIVIQPTILAKAPLLAVPSILRKKPIRVRLIGSGTLSKPRFRPKLESDNTSFFGRLLG